MRKSMLILLLAWWLVAPTWGAELPREVRDALPAAAEEITEELEDPASLSEGLSRLWDRALGYVEEAVRQSIGGGVVLLAAAVLCALTEECMDAAGGKVHFVPMAGALAITLAAAGSVKTMMGLGQETVEELNTFSKALLQRAVGRQLTCIFVDHGLLRKDEGDQVEHVMTKQFNVDVRRVNAGPRFLSKLAGVTDPERKRKIIGEEFIRVFEEEAKKIGAVDFLAQGTIYPDVVESGLGGESTVIKSHHNVGGLPDCVDFKDIVEPLRRLFKDEVRQLGLELGLPEQLVWRQPFPGPGLAIRVIGEITEEKLSILLLPV